MVSGASMNIEGARAKFEQVGVAIKTMKDAMASVTLAAGEAARARWVSLADNELITTRQKYIESIGPVEVRGRTNTMSFAIHFEPVDRLVEAVEFGIGRFDMRSVLLAGRTSRPIRFENVLSPEVRRGGNHISTPFRTRHFTQMETRRLVDSAVAQAAMMPENRRRLPAGLLPLLKTHSVQYAGKGTRSSPRVVKAFSATRNVLHKRDLLAGAEVFRVSPTYGFATTYRTISRSEGHGWIHPGIKARNFIERVQAELPAITDGVVTSMQQFFAKQIKETSAATPNVAGVAAAREAAQHFNRRHKNR